MGDIVERLRAKREREDRLPPEMCGLDAATADEAADEIERLRAAFDEILTADEKACEELRALGIDPPQESLEIMARTRQALEKSDG